LISATVENAAPTHVVLTFPSAKAELVDTDFTVTVNGIARTVSSASWGGSVLTLVLDSVCFYGEPIVVTFVKTGETAAVTNNIAMVAEATALIARMIALSETPVAGRQIIINRTISRLKIAGLWAKLVCLWIMAAHGEKSALLNWIKDLHNLTLANGAGGSLPNFTTDVGFVGNITNKSYIETNFASGTDGDGIFLENSASMGFSQSAVASAGILMGKTKASAPIHYASIGLTNGILNATGAVLLTHTNIIGNIILTKTGTTMKAFVNGNLEDTETVASAAPDAAESMILARNDNGTIKDFADATVDFAFYGGYLTDEEVATLDSILR
jgi:hypothetical protein